MEKCKTLKEAFLPYASFFNINLRKLETENAHLIFEYSTCLYISTLSLSKKLLLIEKTKTSSQIHKAIYILKSNYRISEIDKRNQELLNYHLNRIQPP